VTSQINFQLPAKASGRISGFVQSLSTPIPEFHTEFYMLAILIAASMVVVLRKMKSTQFGRVKPL
jgi:ABC-type branched-subunit amino acid transport system permease subunit